MKITAITFALVGLLASSSMAQQDDALLYPNLPVAREYKHLANLMTDVLIEKVPEATGRKGEIIKFIFQRMSVNSFEKQMLANTNEKDNKANENDSPCSSTAYSQDPTRCEAVSRRMAIMIITQAHDIYIRKYLTPDDLTKPLFARSTDTETDLIISWIEKKVSNSEFRDKSGSAFVTEPDDQIYSYKSTPFSWKLEFGRAGYAVFRNGKLVKNTLTIMN